MLTFLYHYLKVLLVGFRHNLNGAKGARTTPGVTILQWYFSL